jgi:putative endonuclease
VKRVGRLKSWKVKAWIVYMLRCRDGSLYTGVTNHLERRLAAHRAGKGSAYTRSRLPVRIVYREPRASRGAALRREAEIKRLPRAAKLRLAQGGS